jgi:general secretion pathway protein G
MNAKTNAIRKWQRRGALARGFTLIELLLVLVILATLAAIVVPKLSGKGLQAKIAAAGTDISNLSSALTNFEIDCSRFPTTEEGLNALMTQPSGLNGWKGPYLEKGVPNDPFGNKYMYRCPPQHTNVSFDLYSFGPTGQDGAADNIDNWTIKGVDNK